MGNTPKIDATRYPDEVYHTQSKNTPPVGKEYRFRLPAVAKKALMMPP